MNDLISRQAAIDLVRDVCDAVMSGCESWYDPETKDEVYKDIREVDAILKCNKEVRIALRNMPSAQPEKRTEERTETNACDSISRRAAIDAHYEYCNKHPDAGFPVWSLKILEDLPSAQPEIVRCKECKYWKDSDGVYRRGFDAESKCPLNLKKVYEGTFYCGMAERRTDENNNE